MAQTYSSRNLFTAVQPKPLVLSNANPFPEPDYLYHLGLHTNQDLPRHFGDLKAIIVMGSPDRAYAIANRFAAEADCVPQLLGKSERYTVLKTGPVLFCSHGIGQASFSILLHELAKLMYYSGAGAVPIIRIGTSGGLGVAPGTVVITTNSLNGELKEEYCIPILGEMVRRPSDGFAPELVEAIYECRGETPVVMGKTMAADCFYEGQGRLDGSICSYTEADKMNFLQRLHDLGVRNIEMESTILGAFGKQLGIPVGCLCVCLLNRMEGDQVSLTAGQMKQFVERPIELVVRWLHQYLLGLCEP